jgi:hypothetical protein
VNAEVLSATGDVTITEHSRMWTNRESRFNKMIS